MNNTCADKFKMNKVMESLKEALTVERFILVKGDDDVYIPGTYPNIRGILRFELTNPYVTKYPITVLEYYCI